MKSKVLRCLWFTVWGVYGGERNLWGTEMLPQVPFKTMTVPPSANMPSSSLEFVDGYSQKMTPVTGSREGKDHQFWPSSRVFHSAFGERLPETIKDFCSMQDIQVVLDEKVEIRQDKTNRVFRDMYPVDVWEQLTKTNGLLWFFDGSVLYVYQAAEMETKVFQVHPEQAESLLRLVDELGFYSSRLSLRAVKEAGLVIASGPPKFISLIEDMAKNMRFSKPVLAEDLCVRVFPLKHCWAMDRTIGSLTIPGMATILNSILGEAKQTAHLVPTIPIDSSLSHRAEAMKGVLRQKEEMQRKSSSPHKEKEEVFDELSLTSDRKDTLPRGGVIITDGRQNAIIVKDSKQNMPLYEEVIGKLDVPLELIEIKAAIVEINNSVGLSLGTDNTLTFGDAKVRAISINPLGVGGTEETESKNWSLKGIVNGGNFMAAIRYLESQNSAKLLARPSVITMDNMEAVMSRNETYYQSVSGSNKETGNDLFPITSGTTLKVTPHIVGCSDGRPQIQLLLDVKDGSVTPTNEAKKTLSNVNDSTIVTQAVVFEGQSVLVGGYFRETHSFGESGIPFIKELPVLGNAFKTKVKNKSVVERLFLITPTIVRLSASDTDAHGDYFRTVEEGHSVLDNVHENRPGGRSP